MHPVRPRVHACAVSQGWNLRRLDTTLSTVLKDAGFTLPGVNAPYLYFGMWRSTFAWWVAERCCSIGGQARARHTGHVTCRHGA
jgi:hypothetical protein